MSVEKGWGFNAGFALNYHQVESRSADLRALLAPTLPYRELFPVELVLEQLADCTVEVEGRKLALGFSAVDNLRREGETRFVEGRVMVNLRSDVYQAARRGEHRARHTALHEIAHAFTHPDLVVKLSVIPHEAAVLARGEVWHHVCQDTEWQADAIAAAVLAPAKGIAPHERNPASVMSLYGLGYQSAGKRVRVLNRYPDLMQIGGDP